jgi:hypothetical protein
MMRNKLLAYALLGLLTVGCIAISQPHPNGKHDNWEVPGIQAALFSQQALLQHSAIRHLSRLAHPIENPPKALVEKVRSLKADSQFQMDWLQGIEVMANLGEPIQPDDEAKLLRHIQNKQPNISDRDYAVSLLPRTTNPVRHRQLLTKLATDQQEHTYVKYNAALALGGLGTVDVVPDLVKMLRDRREDPWTRGAAALGLSQLGDVAKPYLPEMGDFLRGKTVNPNDRQTMEYQNGQVMTAQALSRWGSATKDYLPDVFAFVKADVQSVIYYHEGMAEVLADYGPAAHDYIPQLITMLEQPEQSGIALQRAIGILGKWGDAAKPALPQLNKLAQNCSGDASLAIARIEPNYPGALSNALRCLEEIRNEQTKWADYRRSDLQQALEVWAKVQGGLDIKTITPVIEQAQKPDDWLLAYRLSGGRSDVLTWIDRQFKASQQVQ